MDALTQDNITFEIRPAVPGPERFRQIIEDPTSQFHMATSPHSLPEDQQRPSSQIEQESIPSSPPPLNDQTSPSVPLPATPTRLARETRTPEPIRVLRDVSEPGNTQPPKKPQKPVAGGLARRRPQPAVDQSALFAALHPLSPSSLRTEANSRRRSE